MGKNKYIETPEKMWELFEEYQRDAKLSPKIKVEYVGREGRIVNTPLEKPLTMVGFENFVADKGLNQAGLGHYFSNLDDNYKDYLGICSRIKRVIRQDQIEGGMAGIYNPSITQRLNNLSEKVEQTNIERPIFKGIDLTNKD